MKSNIKCFILPTLQAGGICGRAARRTHRQAAAARRSRLLQRGCGLPAAGRRCRLRYREAERTGGPGAAHLWGGRRRPQELAANSAAWRPWQNPTRYRYRIHLLCSTVPVASIFFVGRPNDLFLQNCTFFQFYEVLRNRDPVPF